MLIDYKRKVEIPIFIYGTLRETGKYSFYLARYSDTKKEKKLKNFSLHELEDGNFYIKFNKAPDSFVKGELYVVDFATLQMINHLELDSGAFSKRYELVLAYDKKNPNKSFFYFAIKEDRKIKNGDALKEKNIVQYLAKMLSSETKTPWLKNRLIEDITYEFEDTNYIRYI